MKTAYLLVFNGLSDWEPGLVIAEINKSKKNIRLKLSVSTRIGDYGGEVSIVPNYTIDELNYSDTALFILPGGELLEKVHYPHWYLWLEGSGNLNTSCRYMWTYGFSSPPWFFETAQHTSNGKKYLQDLIGDYPGSDLYLNQPSVSDKGVITANGIASAEFARDILGELDIYDQETLKN